MAALMASGALLLTGCSGFAAAPGPDQTTSAAASPTAAASLGPDPTISGNGSAASTVRLATPSPGAPTVAPLESESTEAAEAATAYIDEFLAAQWRSGATPAALGDASVGDCVFFDWEYSSGLTTTALFQVPCQEPHESEVFATVTHADGAYPGRNAFEREAGPPCGDVIWEHLEARLIPTGTHQILFPTEADWESGERTSVCLLKPSFLLERGYFGT